MPIKPFTVERIESISEETIAVVVQDKHSATQCLKKNPRCSVMEQENGDFVLVYPLSEIDLTRAIKRV